MRVGYHRMFSALVFATLCVVACSHQTHKVSVVDSCTAQILSTGTMAESITVSSDCVVTIEPTQKDDDG